MPAAGREFPCVRQQVRQNLLHLGAVAATGDGRISGDEIELDVFREQLRLDEGSCAVERLLHRDRPDLDAQVSRLELGEIEHVVDEPQEVALVRLDALHRVALLR